MASSINGWPVLLRGSHDLKTYTIPGCPDRRLTLAKDAAPVLLYVAAYYHANVHALDRIHHHKQRTVDEAGYNYRSSRVSTRWSNHSSGSAIDLDWSKEGSQGSYARRWWSRHPVKLKQLDGFLRELEGAVTWGYHWHGRYWDPMHFEIAKGWTPHKLDKLERKLGIDKHGVRS